MSKPQSGALTAGQPSARLLDLTRLVSRSGLQQTGLDRVEAKYLERFLQEPLPLFSLVRTVAGGGPWRHPVFTLLDRQGSAALADRLLGITPFGRPDLRAILRRRARPAQRAAYADLRRLGLEHSDARGLAPMLERHLPKGTAWVNCSHLNMETPVVFEAMTSIDGGRSSVFIHDVIPLDYPAYTMPHAAESFSKTLRHASEYADLIICNSDHTRQTATRHFEIAGRVPPMITAHLGVDLPVPDPSAIPSGIDTGKPYFVVLGTIEPRKNHTLLLDIWEHFAAILPDQQIPKLLIIGKRGWLNKEVFARLDTSPLIGRYLHEMPNLDDSAVAALITGAQALLMPSVVEGFGLPPAEALALGTPALVNDLPVYREVLGNNPVYLPVTDMYSWAEKILELARADRKERKAAVGEASWLPTWQEHFNLVLKVT